MVNERVPEKPTAASISRKRRLAQQLIDMGQQQDPNASVGGIVIRQNPLGQLARALTQGIGSYVDTTADRDQKDIESARTAKLAAAIKQTGTDAKGAGLSLIDDPELQGAGMKMYSDAITGEKQAARDAARFQQQKQLIDYREAAKANNGGGSGYGSLPPAMVDPSVPQNTPVTPLDTRGLSGKDASMYTKETRLDAQKRLQDPDFVSAAQKSRNNINEADRFSQLQNEQGTGGIYSIPLVGDVVGAFNPKIREMKSIQDRLAPQQRSPGSGGSSDTDVKMFQNALPGPDKPAKTNSNIIEAIKTRENDVQNYQSFLNDYFQANGHLNDADKQWQTYINDNPIFDPQESNTSNFKLNKNRRDYKSYFSGQQPMAPAQPQADQLRMKAEAAVQAGADPIAVQQIYEKQSGQSW